MLDLSRLTALIDSLLRETWGLSEFWVLFIEFVLVGAALLTAYAVLALILIYVERKITGFFQCRLGPNRVGKYGMVQSVADIVVELDLAPKNDQVLAQHEPHKGHEKLEPDALALLQCLEPYPLTRDAVLEKSGFSPARLSELLLLLELDGLIEMLAGDQLRKISG